MKKEDAIKYLQQLYPNGGHCWLDEQRIEAINMAVKALQEEPVSEQNLSNVERTVKNWKEPVSEELEEASKNHAVERFRTTRDEFLAEKCKWSFKAGAQWQKEQIMAKVIDVEVKVDAGGYPYIPTIELYDYDKDIPLANEGDKYNVVLIKEG